MHVTKPSATYYPEKVSSTTRTRSWPRKGSTISHNIHASCAHPYLKKVRPGVQLTFHTSQKMRHVGWHVVRRPWPRKAEVLSPSQPRNPMHELKWPLDPRQQADTASRHDGQWRVIRQLTGRKSLRFNRKTKRSPANKP